MRTLAAFSLIEVLISLAILSFALLGLLQLQVVSLDYQYEAVLLTRAGLIFRDAGFAYIYQMKDDANERSKQMANSFPQGQYQATDTGNSLQQKITWRTPKQAVYQLQFTLR